jgi:uncharacterized protein (TIGR02246 family)
MMRAVVSGQVVVWVLAFATMSGAAQAPNAEVQKLAEAYASAWAKGDAKAIAAMFEPEGVMVGGFGDVAAGRAQIEQNLVKTFAGPFKGSKIRVVPEGTRQVGTDTVITVGSYEITGGTGATGQQVSVRGRYLNTFVRRNGQLMMAASATNIPPQAQGK